jgi:glycosyltransferase involved in cell wall biosynthesis
VARRALLILYYYPPIGGIGGIRTLRLARHLPAFGWEPLVLTVSENTIAAIPCDISEGELEGVMVFRTANPDIAFRAKRLAGLEVSQTVNAIREQEPGARSRAGIAERASSWLGVPDRFIDWLPFAWRTGVDICRTVSPEVIFSSSPPETCQLAAACVKASTGLPWLADLRDPWLEKFNMPRPPLVEKVNGWLESKALSRADRITAVTPPIVDEIERRLGLPVAWVAHSYDEEALAATPPVPDDCFNILYAGSLYYPAQDPSPIFRALGQMRESGRDISRIKVQFAGKGVSVAQRLASEHGVADRVEVLGLLPFKEAVAREKGAKALLYVQVASQGKSLMVSEGPSGKLLEYLGAGRPVLSLMPVPGPVDDFLRDTGAGEVARDAQDARRVLEKWLDEYESKGELAHAAPAGIERYSSKAMVGRFAELFDEMTRPGATTTGAAGCDSLRWTGSSDPKDNRDA